MTPVLRRLSASLINAIGNIPVVGDALRRVARRYPEGSVVTIQAGFAAGMRWQRHHRYVNGYWVGNYEMPIQAALARLLAPGDVFYDVGANAGFFSLLAAKQVGDAGRVFAFEPLPENLASLREQIAVNSLSHVEIVEGAIGATTGTAELSFASGQNSEAHLGSPKSEGESVTTVPITTLDAFVAAHRRPTLVKVDVEGAETAVLEGAPRLLADGTTFLIELHGIDKGMRVSATLREAGYRLERLDGSVADLPEREHHLIARRPGRHEHHEHE